jgi:hypothetical protein
MTLKVLTNIGIVILLGDGFPVDAGQNIAVGSLADW